MINYQKSNHLLKAYFLHKSQTVVSPAATLLHAVMLSNLFVSWVEDMLVLTRLKSIAI